MFSYFKKNKIISLSIILTSAVFIFSAQLNYAEAEDLPVIDQTQIKVSEQIRNVSNLIANLLSGDTASFGGGGKGAENYRLQAEQK